MKISFSNAVTTSALKPERFDQVTGHTEVGFGDILNKAIKGVDRLQKAAEASTIALAVGDVDNLHQVMIDAQKAEIALQYTLQVRNKILDAYQEIMRMQI